MDRFFNLILANFRYVYKFPAWLYLSKVYKEYIVLIDIKYIEKKYSIVRILYGAV